jgi:acyl dehydratase
MMTKKNPPLATAQLHVTRAVIHQYASLTDDFNPIHVDPEFAATTPMGGIIAHGMLSLNLVWQSLRTSFGDAAIARAIMNVRFLKPVRENDLVTAGGEQEANGHCAVWVRNQKDETVIAGHIELDPLASAVAGVA